MKSFEKIGHNTYITASNALVHFSAKDHKDEGKVEQISVEGYTMEIKKWGSDNLLPNRREELLMENNIVGQLISKKREILLGKGLMPYRVEYDGTEKKIVPLEMEANVKEVLYDQLDIMEKFLDPAGIELYKNAGFVAIGVRDRKGRIVDFISKESKYMRAERKKQGTVRNWWYSSDWRRNSTTSNNLLEPLFIKKYPVFNKEDKNQKSFVIYKGDKTFFDGYYYHPPYWGGKYWIEFANQVPQFHRANINNRYSVAFHITYPEGYFLDTKRLNDAGSDEKKKEECYNAESEAVENFLKLFNDIMMGASNAGKTLHTEQKWNHLLKEYQGIEIKEITYNMNDDALLKAWEKSNEANISGQGIHPSVANIMTQGKLSSGSEIRNAFLFYIATATYWPRKLLTDCVQEILKSHNLYKEDVHYTFEDFMITKLDEDKSGMKPANADAE